jgi:hypothetical protein
MGQSKAEKREAAQVRAKQYVPNPDKFGLRQRVKSGTMTRVEVKALVDDPNLSDTFRLWAHRYLKRNQTNPPRGDIRPELDAGRGVSPGGKKKSRRRRKKAKVSKASNR